MKVKGEKRDWRFFPHSQIHLKRPLRPLVLNRDHEQSFNWNDYKGNHKCSWPSANHNAMSGVAAVGMGMGMTTTMMMKRQQLVW